MENYNEFLNRIYSFEKRELYLGNDYFNVNPNLMKKVNTDNKFSDFYGDTVVFDLPNELKNKINDIISVLYRETPDCFADRLISSTLHMTLHDLYNSPALENVSSDIFNSEINLSKKLCNSPIKKTSIRMKTTAIFNMVNTSMVLGLIPVDDQEYEKLITLYNYIDEIKSLPYPLTPHITLAYYNRNGFNLNSARKLEKIVTQINENYFEVEISTDKLYYQKFTNMNNYINIFAISHSK